MIHATPSTVLKPSDVYDFLLKDCGRHRLPIILQNRGGGSIVMVTNVTMKPDKSRFDCEYFLLYETENVLFGDKIFISKESGWSFYPGSLNIRNKHENSKDSS